MPPWPEYKETPLGRALGLVTKRPYKNPWDELSGWSLSIPKMCVCVNLRSLKFFRDPPPGRDAKHCTYVVGLPAALHSGLLIVGPSRVGAQVHVYLVHCRGASKASSPVVGSDTWLAASSRAPHRRDDRCSGSSGVELLLVAS